MSLHPHPSHRLRAFLLILIYPIYSQVLAGHTISEQNVIPPAFSIPDLKGARHTLDDYRGRVVLVNFWASWCPPCIREMPALERLETRFAGRPFAMLAINSGEQKFRVWKFIRLVDFDATVLLDGDTRVSGQWDVTTLPTSFLIDRDGRLRYLIQGVPDWESDTMLALIEALIAQQEKQP